MSTDLTSPPAHALAWDDLAAAARDLDEGAYLATVGRDGQPHVAYVMPGWGDEGTLWFSTFRRSQKARNLRAGGAVAMHWPQRMDALLFVRGTARVVDDAEEVRRLWSAGVLPYDPGAFFSGPDNPQLMFVEVSVEQASVGSLDPHTPKRRWTRPGQSS